MLGVFEVDVVGSERSDLADGTLQRGAFADR